MTTRALLVLSLSLIACRDTKPEPAVLRPAQVVPTTTPMVAPPPSKPVVLKDDKKGDKQDSEWTPAEFKTGMARWKDTGIYVDGKPLGFMNYGELPVTLKPTWIKDKVSANKRPGTDDPGWRWARQRFYKFTDYLKALGIEPASVKEIHVYGPKMSETLIATGAELTSPLGNEFMFRFGGDVFGKAIPHSPGGFGNGKSGDKITAVMVYIKKKPPHLIRNEGLELDGVMQTGVPYFGDPIRGGVRIYLDDKLAAIIKRQELDPKKAKLDDKGEPHFKLSDVFAAQGVDTKKLVEAWIIRGERREERIPADKLLTLTFQASSQGRGGIQFDGINLKANALALHTRAIDEKEIDRPTPDDE